MSKILGIDLGTSNSAAAIIQAGRPTIVPSAEGASLYGKAFPSVVAFNNGSVLVGEPAKRQAVSNPKNTIMAAKRKMGSGFKYEIDNKEYTPQQISAFILQKIKKDAEEFLGEKIEKAVVTVPAYFDDDQRQATKDAGKIAGLDVVRIINEPTAASLAYGLDKKEKEQKILVFDFGGGTLDVTIMEFGDGVFEVKSTSGDTQLGGTDMDETIMKHILENFQKETGIDVNDDPTALQRVREAAEKAKIELSTTLETDVNLPFISATDKGPKHLNMKLTRAELERLVDSTVNKCKKALEQSLKDSKLTSKDIDKVILVGGPTRMPIVRKFVEDFIGKESERGVDPMECVANGAAVQGGVLAGDVKDVLLLDVTPLTLGIETLGGIKTQLIERNTTIPTKKSQVFSTATDNQPAVTINVLQGEREMASDNKSLGRFELTGLPPAPRGVPQIEVAFDIDANGIINVNAKDMGTGKEQTIKITASQKLDEKEVEKMKKDAEKYAEEDKKRKEDIEVRNNADTTIYTTEKMIKDQGDKIDRETKDKIEKEINELKETVKENNTEKIKAKLEEVNKVAQEIGTKMYQEAMKEQQEKAKTEDKKETKDKEKVVDAEVVDEKEGKKEKK
ncbi:MAG: molecular chaperone DnaK [Candidatus Nanoarchaeia archaeon]|jgi:molecular chaperone DnaK|nr:molecular chaperone DnaK [Candidatus Nanoarchaeia archaeon]|tara:strand:+ start:22325 stop:24184 length:1860 start_codon:yes stop_codon:yes gene_type:complete